MPVQSPALVTGSPSANHRVNLPAFAIAEAVQEAAVRCTLATGLAAAALAGYVVSRSVGLPGAMDDIGNWTEPLGLASIVVEGLLVAVGLAALARPTRLTAR